ncbi:unnamed protein product [Urochloa humidicola]
MANNGSSPGGHRCGGVLAMLLLVSVGAGASGDSGSGGGVEAGDEAAGWTGGLSRRSFPKGFVFGTAASAYQVEGMALKDGRGPSIWDAFVKIPGEIANNATADVTVDEYHRYKEDVKIMKTMGFDAYRFSISWSRIFPNGAGKVNWKGVAYYNRLINYMLKIEALEVQYGGLLNRKVVKAFADYADFCFKTFGDRVKNWMTFNEPRVVAALGYDDGRFAPGRCTKCTEGNSATEPYIVAHHLILSHAAAVQRYRQKYQPTQKGRIGILLDFVWYEALTNSTADQAAAQRSRDFHVGWFLHPIIYGEYPKSVQEIVKERLPKFTADEIKMVKGSIDYVGVNQYTAYYMNAKVCLSDQGQILIGFISCLGDYIKQLLTSRRSMAIPQCFYLKTVWMTQAMSPLPRACTTRRGLPTTGATSAS